MNHLACIMDGNRRWAKKHGKLSIEGHRAGVETVKRVIRFCLDRGIPYLSLYAFSLENLKRSETEKNYLFDLIAMQADSVITQSRQDNVRIRFVGDRSLFPVRILSACERIEQETDNGSRLTVNILFCYGGQQEIVAGVKTVLSAIHDGILTADELDVQKFKKYLWMHETPEPELIIRTGGHKRLSNFLLFYAAYSELYFLDCMWPDLTETDLIHAIETYQRAERNFGV